MKLTCVVSLVLQMVYFTHSNHLQTNQGLKSQQCADTKQNQAHIENVQVQTAQNNDAKDNFLQKILKRFRREPGQSKKKQKQIRKDLIKRGLPPRSTPTPKILYQFEEDHLIHLPKDIKMVWYRVPRKMPLIMERPLQTINYGITLNKSVITFFTVPQKRNQKFFGKRFGPGGKRGKIWDRE